MILPIEITCKTCKGCDYLESDILPEFLDLYGKEVVHHSNFYDLLTTFSGSEGHLVFTRRIGSNNYFIVSDDDHWDAGTLYHVAAVIDPSSGMKMYINGVLQTDTDPTTAPTQNTNEEGAIGRWGDLNSRYFNGDMDEVRIWKIARTQSEIDDYKCHQLDSAQYIPDLYVYYNFDDPVPGVAKDIAGSLHGDIHGCIKHTEKLCHELFSYITYDGQGRIDEVGQLWAEAEPTQAQIDDWENFPQNFGYDEHQITKTHYDTEISGIGLNQEHLRGRVAAITYTHQVYAQDYDYASHYSYDFHGNVHTLVQEDKNAPAGYEMKTMEYEYDLVSGNVNLVKYQEGYTDQFYHRYSYDADNRIITVETSPNGIIWDEDADYSYYLHGPLARTQLGEHHVQGIDYAYTIHGWIKGVNSNILDAENDMGKDGPAITGYTSGGNAHSGVAKDAFSYSLHYYEDDYKAVNNTIPSSDFWLASTSGSYFANGSPDLFNGNISRMTTNLIEDQVMDGTPANNTYDTGLQGTVYSYDQLNRLKSMKVHEDGNLSSTNAWDAVSNTETDNYSTYYAYDANGNIDTLTRNDGSGTAMDEFIYRYQRDANGDLVRNRLYHVDEAISGSSPSGDIEPFSGSFTNNTDPDQQADGNYTYDAIGNLIKDDAEEIAEISWTVYGKIERITRISSSIKPDLEFKYGPDGNRIQKIAIDPTSGEHTITYYVRDAQGNIYPVK